MKKLFYLVFVLSVAGPAFSQSPFTAGVFYTATPTTGAPSSTGSRFRVDLTTQYIYQWNPTAVTWQRVGQGIDLLAGTSDPAYTPTANMSWFVINDSNKLFHYSGSGTAWDCINCDEVIFSGDLSGSATSQTVIGLQSRPVSSSAPGSGEVLKWNGSAWAPGADLGTTYTAGTGIDVTGTVISNTGDLDNTNEAWTIDGDDSDMEVISTQIVKFEGGGINVTDYDPVTNTLLITATEIDGSTSNEIQALSAGDGIGDNKTLDLSLGGGTVTLDPAGILTISRSGNTLTLTAIEVDGSVTNELQTYGHAGSTSYTNTLSDGGGSFTLQASGIASISHTGGTVTISATEIDGSTSNEIQALSAGDGAGDNKTLDLSLGGGTVTLDPAGILSISRSGNTLTLTATEADGSISNELQTYGHAGSTSYTNTLSDGGGAFTLQASGIVSISHTAGTVTISAAEVDGSTSNELQALTAGDGAGDNKTLDLSLGGGAVTLDPAGILTISRIGNTLTLTATEAQTLSYTDSNGELTISGGNTVTIPVFVGATSSVDGEQGLVPQPLAGDESLFLRGDGTWGNPTVGGDNWGSQVVQHGSTLTGNGTSGTPLNVATDGITANEISTGAVGSSEVLDNSLVAGDLAVNVVSSVDGVTNDGGNIDLVAGSGISITPDDGTDQITIANTDPDQSTTNEIQALTAGDGAGDNKTLDLSLGGGTVTLDPAGILTISRSGNTLTLTGTEVDGSVTNEVLTVSDGTDSEALGGQTLTFEGSGITTVDYTPATNTLTINSTEVDGSTSNEIQALSYNPTTDEISLSLGGGTIDISEVNTDAQTLSWNGGTGEISISGGNTIDIDGRYLESEVDGSVTNEGALTVGAGSGSTSVISSNTSGSTDVTIAVAGILSIGEVGNTITITGTEVDGSVTNEVLTVSDGTDSEALGGQTLTFEGSGIATVDYTPATNTLTIDATEVDGSVTNEGSLTVSAGTSTTSIINSNTSGSTGVTLTAAGALSISETGNNITLTATEVDGSVTNEGSLTVGAGTSTTSIISSNTSGSTDVTLSAGSGISIGEAGNTITISATGGSGNYQTWRDNGADATTEPAANFVSTADISFSLTDDSGNAETEVRALIVSNGVDYGQIQTVAGQRILGNPTGSTANVSEISLGSGLSFVGSALTPADASTTNEAWTIDGDDADTEVISNQTVKFEGAGITSTDYNPATDVLLITSTEVDGSVTNELQTYGHAGSTSYTNTLSDGGGSFTLQASGIASISHTGGTVTISATEVDGSTSNEIQALSAGDGAGDNKTLDLSLGGGTVTLDPAGILSISRSGNTLTLTATEADGSTTNENLTISDGTDSEDLGGQTLNVAGSGIASVDYVPASNTLTISATEVDGSVTNEGSLTVGAGTSTTSIISSNTSGSTDITLTAGTGITLAEAGNNITISASGGGGGAPTDAQYLVLSADATLSAERVFTAGTNTSASDAGAGSTLTLNVLSGNQTTSQFTSDQDDWNPTNWSSRTTHYVSSDGSIRAITSMTALPDGTYRRLINTGTSAIYLPGEHPDGTASNRIITEADKFIAANGGVSEFVYDGNVSRWRLINSTFNPATPGINGMDGVFYNISAGATITGDWGDLGIVGNVDVVGPSSTYMGGYALNTGSSASGEGHLYFTDLILNPTEFGLTHSIGSVIFQTTGNLSTSAQRYTLAMGFIPSPSATALAVNNSIGIRYTDNENGGNWTGFTRNTSGTESTLDLGVTVAANTTYVLTVCVDKANSEARYYVNGIARGRITTNLPTGGTDYGFRAGIWKSVGTTLRDVVTSWLTFYTIKGQ